VSSISYRGAQSLRAAVERYMRAGVAWAKIALAPWHRRALMAILALSAFCEFFQLSRIGLGNLYYAAAVKSMLTSWHNFFFVAFDPGGFVSVDKPPLGFWIQAASAKLFGFSGWSLLLPEALAAVVSVAVLYHLVQRAFGPVAGLLAALALALMPISVVTSRDNTIDSLLVLAVLLAAWAVCKAAETGSLGWLLVGAVLVGLGFNIKMLEAYLVVPALGLLYLLAAPRRLRTRIGHLALASVLLLGVSLSWALAVDATPAVARPYVGSSSTNSEIELAFGYNGLERLTGRLFGRGGAAGGQQGRAPANRTPATRTPPAGRGAPRGGGFFGGENGAPSPLRLFNEQIGPQISWLLPLALLGLLASGWGMRKRLLFASDTTTPAAPLSEARMSGDEPGDEEEPAPRVWRLRPLDRRQQAFVLWGMWFLTQAVFFSVAGFFHTYYMVMLAPAVAALAGIGAVELARDYRRPGWRGWLLPIALVATALVQALWLSTFPAYGRWLTPLVVGTCVLAAGLLVRLRFIQMQAKTQPEAQQQTQARIVLAEVASGRAPAAIGSLPEALLGRVGHVGYARIAGTAAWARRMATPTTIGFAVMAAGLAALLLAPATWVTVSLARGGAALPVAGPVGQGGFGGGFGRRPATASPTTPPAQDGAATQETGNTPYQVNARLVAYLDAHQGSARYLLATTNANSAAPFILATDKPVMAMGGFLGSDPILTPDALARLVAQGQVRYFLLSGREPVRIGPAMLEDLPPQIAEMIEEGGFGFPGGSGGPGGGASLTSWVTTHCATVPPGVWGGGAASGGDGGFGGAQQLYDCSAAVAG
jgi:4-amino-4-deoxy-L-arabinose transferase-like glycosyltransferase